MAGQISELSRQSLRRNFRHIDPASARVVLLEAGPVLLPTFGSRLSGCTKRSLGDLGVDVRVNAKVVDVDSRAVTYERDGVLESVEATTKVWAAGVRASPVGQLLTSGTDATTNRSGQVVVNPDCSVAGHPEVFVVGDLMAVPGTPAVAQVAIQSGEYAARTISRRLAGPLPPRHLPVSRQGVSGDHLPVPCGGEHPLPSVDRATRVVAVAGRPPAQPVRLREPCVRRSPLGADLQLGATGRACRHARTRPGTRTTGTLKTGTRRRDRDGGCAARTHSGAP